MPLTARVVRLERRHRPNGPLSQMSDAQLIAHATGHFRAILACPDAPEPIRETARQWLALPHHLPRDQWTEDDEDAESAVLRTAAREAEANC